MVAANILAQSAVVELSSRLEVRGSVIRGDCLAHSLALYNKPPTPSNECKPLKDRQVRVR